MNSSFNDLSSWEEISFAEDAAGALGGCVWPPRSYSCSFCRREFRSAQALGGHMNVHRRDRARLKQISNHHPSPLEPRNQHPTNPNDDPLSYSSLNPEFTGTLVSIPSHVSGVSRSASENTSSVCFLEMKRKDCTVPWSSFVPAAKSTGEHVLDINMNKKYAVLEPATKGLSVNLNLAACKAQSNRASNGEEVASCKRRRIEATNPKAGIFTKSSTSLEICISKPEAFKLCSGAAEGLDLELRLGNAPKVK